LTERFPLDYQDLAQPLRERAGRYGETRFALPIGASALVLAYRRDAMESPTNQAAAKEHGLALNPPSTWAELDALARFFHGRDWDGDGQPDQGLAFASGPNPDSDALFLSLAASFGLPPDYVSYLFDLDTMEPLVTAPPFERALESFLSLAKSSPENPKGLGAAAARAAFRSGRVALLLDRAEFVADWIDRKKPLPIGVAPLPGSSQVYDPDRKAWVDANPPNAPPVLPSGGGWFAGLAARSNESARSAALDVVRFLACSESTRALSADPTAHMLPTRSALFAEGIPDPRAALGVDSSGWAAGIEAALDNPRAVPGLRVPDARGYMTDLSQARTRALAGTPPREALETLRAAWSERTKKLGLERQRWHYRRSLNRVASETPPPRAESP
jgi:multiple sugar transport system substrate-binding protein